ncbi:hypothetical protein CQY20_32790 [Mycolicibacterium agri]|uniref:Uncharacterized protein n=1 Tax=Mycolicibacterium agri TaxID=36811 RepID=A0A2A7MN14_MYCAG|nr:hypothetical protein [Mycolicibacterium agri]PEG33066.1 hypothetical protein CQY20_32790 [Mycolicibacterium agri]
MIDSVNVLTSASIVSADARQFGGGQILAEAKMDDTEEPVPTQSREEPSANPPQAESPAKSVSALIRERFGIGR